MAPTSLRRILPPDTLAVFGAVPIIYDHHPSLSSHSNEYNDGRGEGQVGVATTSQSCRLPETSARPPVDSALSTTTATPTTPQNDVPSPNGIEIAGWKIMTSNSSIGDEKRMELLTLLLENTANSELDATTDDDDDCGGRRRRRRRLCPPEITFLDAIILLQYQGQKNDNNVMTGIRFMAQDALLEWAEAHQHLEVQNDDDSQQRYDHNTATSLSSIGHRIGEYRGVSIIRTADAKIWSEREKNNKFDGVNAPPRSAAINSNMIDTLSGKSEFYYDWTFSSPYAGTILHYEHIGNVECNNTTTTIPIINHRNQWQPLTNSHIPFHLLQDTTQPILLFDDIYLYEDDLHDNGDVSMNIKLRVMPTCWFALQRLVVRVDYVRIRCREVRCFCLFEATGRNNSRSYSVQENTIYRDIVWKEATWEELGKLGLPMDPAAWRECGGHPVAAASSGGGGPQQLASLLARLPTVPLPEDMPQFACYDACGN